MYLIEDHQKEQSVRDPRRPCKNICPRRKENRDQAEDRTYELDVANAVSEESKEDLLYIKECGKIGHIYLFVRPKEIMAKRIGDTSLRHFTWNADQTQAL